MTVDNSGYKGVTCPECGTENILADECPTCRVLLSKYFPACPNCSTLVPPDMPVCYNCHHVLIKPAEAGEPQVEPNYFEYPLAISLKFNIEDILKDSWWIFNERLNLFLFISLIQFPFQAIINYSIWNDYTKLNTTEHPSFSFSLWILSLFSGIIWTFIILAVVFASNKIIKRERVTLRYALQLAYSKLASTVWAKFLSLLIVYGLILCLIVPGIIWYCYYFFVIHAVALREKRGKAALNYSKMLVKGRWWKVLLYTLLPLAIAMVPGALTAVLPVSIGESLAATIISSGLVSIFGCFSTIVMYVLFLNLDYTHYAQHRSSASVPSGAVQIK